MQALASPGIPFTLAMFLLVVGLLVFIHEFGHYGVARLFGIDVETFAIGFGREIAGWTDRAGTRWKIGWLPLGGYAKFRGDMNAASQPDPALRHLPKAERAGLFQFRPLWQRALVVAAGPAINFLFAILVFSAFFLMSGQQYALPVAGSVVPGSPAAAAGLRAGDRFAMVDHQHVDRFEEVMRIIVLNPGRPVPLLIERDGAMVALSVVPRAVLEADRFGNQFRRGMIGVTSGPMAVRRLGPAGALGAAVEETGAIVRMMGETVWQVLSGRRALDEMGGPLRIAQFSGQTASLGPGPLIGFMALISINLGFINLLPVPMLDGGHLLLYALEAVRRRPLNPKVQEWAFLSGLALLVSLMLILTWNDLSSMGVWDRVARLVG
jgi:regulator of sigma E protease